MKGFTASERRETVHLCLPNLLRDDSQLKATVIFNIGDVAFKLPPGLSNFAAIQSTGVLELKSPPLDPDQPNFSIWAGGFLIHIQILQSWLGRVLFHTDRF